MSTKKSRATVTISERAVSKGPRKLWGYSYEDLAYLFDCHVGSVRRNVAEKAFDPADLGSVFRFFFLHRPMTRVWTNVRRSDVARDLADLAGFPAVDVVETAKVYEVIRVQRRTPRRFLLDMVEREQRETGVLWEVDTARRVFRFAPATVSVAGKVFPLVPSKTES